MAVDATELANWRESARVLYDLVNLSSLEWPSMSVDFVKFDPESRDDQESSNAEPEAAGYVLTGTFSKQSENYVKLSRVALPNGPVTFEDRNCERRLDYTGFKYPTKEETKFTHLRKIDVDSGSVHRTLAQKLRPPSDATPTDANDPKTQTSSFLGAAVTSTGGVTVFGLDCDPKSAGGRKVPLRVELEPHAAPAWGLAWSPFNPGELVTACDAGVIKCWDVQASGKRGLIKPTTTYAKMGHMAACQMVIPNFQSPHSFITGGDDGKILLWDRRVCAHTETPFLQLNFVSTDCPDFLQPGVSGLSAPGAGAPGYQHHRDGKQHEMNRRMKGRQVDCGSFNGLSQNYHRDYLLASAGSDNDVLIWDMRFCGFPVAALSSHTNTVNSVKFCPQREHYLASCGADGRVNIWDLRDVGRDQSAEAASDGPPELLFSHAGHPAAVQDVDWAPGPDGDLSLVSVDDVNQLHVWRMDLSVFYRSESDEASEQSDDDFPVE